ncbi:MAG TPA: macro domain-containing protein [Labilithrix sp.]|nr:macro domain-containing protein [Labilithrix sp.]
MPTTFVKGDLFEDSKGAPPPRAFAFAADCSGSMDRGIAVAFKKRFGPALADAYRARAAGGKMQLGDVFMWKGNDGKGDVVVYALGTQQGDKKPKVSIVARALEGMVARALGDGVTRIALPRIGAGKGGADRLRVKRVLTEIGDKSAVTLVVFEQFIRAAAETTA